MFVAFDTLVLPAPITITLLYSLKSQIVFLRFVLP